MSMSKHDFFFYLTTTEKYILSGVWVNKVHVRYGIEEKKSKKNDKENYKIYW